MNNILILSAFPEEQKYYFEKFTLIENKEIGFVDVSIVDYQGTKLYFATTGMGTTNASIVVATLSAVIKFDYIFFSGSSGGVDKKLKIGDVVIASETFDADIFSIHEGVVGTPFEGALVNPNIQEKTLKFFPCSDLDYDFVDDLKFSAHKGLVATSNFFPSPAFLFSEIKGKGALVIDMESNAITQFSWLSKIPCLIIRGVSNLLDDSGLDEEVHNSDVSSSDHAAIITMLYLNSLVKSEEKYGTQLSFTS